MKPETCSGLLLRTVAGYEGVDPVDLPPLQETVDVDALERLVDSADNDALTVTFDYCGYEVTVDGDGDVSVEDPDE
jgi:hypothetical protein